MTELRILFLTHPLPSYVTDLLLHGLRKLLGSNVIDYPRKDSLYSGHLLGVSIEDESCPQWFPNDNASIDRDDILRKVRTGYFNYIIFDLRLVVDIKANQYGYADFYFNGIRSIPLFQDDQYELPNGLVLIDGEDYPSAVPMGPYVICRRETSCSDYNIPLPMALPEEISAWIKTFDKTPKRYSIGFIGSSREFYHGGSRADILQVLSNRYKDTCFKETALPSQLIPRPEGRLNREDYYVTMQSCKIVLSLRGEGYDTFRFWENAAMNAVHVSQSMPLLIPNDFTHNVNIFKCANINELIRTIDNILDGDVDSETIIKQSHLHLERFHTTTKRAAYLLEELHKAFRR